MATRKVYGGMIHPGNGGSGGGGNKPPFNFGNFKPGPQNAMNNNSPNTRRKKKNSGASKKKGHSAKKYGKNNVVFRRKTRVNAHVKGRRLENIQAGWNANQMLSNMERLGIKKKEKKKGIKFEN